MQQICSCRQFLLLNIHDKNWTVVNFEQVCSFSQSSTYFYDDCRLGYWKKKWQWQMTKHLDSQQTEFCCNFFHEQCWRSWWQFPNFTKMNPVVNYCQSHSRIPRCFKMSRHSKKYVTFVTRQDRHSHDSTKNLHRVPRDGSCYPPHHRHRPGQRNRDS